MSRYLCPECGKTISKIREHLKTVHNVSNVNMDKIQCVKFDSSSHPNADHQLKSYELCGAGGSLPLPLGTKDGGVALSLVSQSQPWSL